LARAPAPVAERAIVQAICERDFVSKADVPERSN
jgi:hypothetical protein